MIEFIRREKSEPKTNSICGIANKTIIALMLATTLVASGCAKKPVPDSASQLGLGKAAPGSQQDFTVNVGDRVFFQTDSSSLTDQSRATLDRQAQWLSRYPKHPVLIEGHADERGTREYNLALGGRRAAATVSYLAAKGVSRSRMKTISYGKERPVAVCDNISCWSQNRRAVTLLGGAGS